MITLVDQSKLGYRPTVTRSKYDRLHDRIDKLYDSHRRGLLTTTELMEQARHVTHVFD